MRSTGLMPWDFDFVKRVLGLNNSEANLLITGLLENAYIQTVDNKFYENFIDLLCYPRNEVIDYLRNRSKIYSFHEIEDGVLEIAESLVIFRYNKYSAV